MIEDKTVLGIIPARSGSKGLPKKNILPLAGKPLIAWSIEAAKKSKNIDQFIVSTDSDKIAEVAKSYKCQVPFKRPKNLALDNTTSFDVIEHAIHHFQKNSINFDYVILLEPTSPIRTSEDIDKAISILHNKRDLADSIVGVSKVEATHPVFDVKVNESGLIRPFMNDSFDSPRRQDIEELYFFEGTIYISATDVLLQKKTFYHERTLPYFIPKWKSIEVDEITDLLFAETVINNISKFKKGDK